MTKYTLICIKISFSDIKSLPCCYIPPLKSLLDSASDEGVSIVGFGSRQGLQSRLYDKLDVFYEKMVDKVLECFMEGVNSASVNNVNAVNAGDENSIPTLCVNAFAPVSDCISWCKLQLHRQYI